MVLADAEYGHNVRMVQSSGRLRLSPEARQTLEAIAKLRGGVPFAEVVRRALGTELFFIQAEKEGSRILLESSDKSIRQIVLR